MILLQLPVQFMRSGFFTASVCDLPEFTGMGLLAEELKKRTFQFAVAITELVRKLPGTLEGRRIGGQLFDAATSVAANYRAACNETPSRRSCRTSRDLHGLS